MKNLILIFIFLFTLTTAGAGFAQSRHVYYKGNKKYVTTTHRGWSKRAKGAAIGGGAGAIGGALIGHGVKGALVGGALGAGAGYVIGNESDKNKSRATGHTVYKTKTVN